MLAVKERIDVETIETIEKITELKREKICLKI